MCEAARSANTALEVLEASRVEGVDVAGAVAILALKTVQATLRDAPINADVVVVDRQGGVIARAE